MLSQSDGNDLKTLSNIVACFSSDLTRSYEVASLLKIVYALCKGITDQLHQLEITEEANSYINCLRIFLVSPALKFRLNERFVHCRLLPQE